MSSASPPISVTSPSGSMRAVLRAAGTVAGLLAGPTGIVTASQDRVIDGGSLVILRDGVPVGSEEFQLRRTQGPGGSATFALSATAYYPADRPSHVLSAQLRFRGDSLVTSARFEAQSGQESTFALVTVGSRRVTVRMRLPGRESTREYPGTAPSVLLDDSLFSVHALRLPRTDGSVGLLWPRIGRRIDAEVTYHGTGETDLHGRTRVLHHVSLGRGQTVRHLWFDDEGRLHKVSAPGVGLTAVRESSGR